MNNENLQPVQKLTPFTKMVMSIGTLPSSFYASMSYYESMVWLYEYLKNQIIPTVNNNGEAVEELQGNFILLQEAFNNLKEWTETYTEETIPEEIDKKLDEMAEDGTLENLLTKLYLTRTYNTLFDLYEDRNNIFDGMKLNTLGFYSINDGGQGNYFVTSIENPDIYQLELKQNLYIEIATDEINILQLGAKNDGLTHPLSEFFNSLIEAQKLFPLATDLNDEVSYVALYTAINKFYKKINIPSGEYLINKTLSIPRSQVLIEGFKSVSSILKYTGSDTSPFISCTNYNYLTINNLQITGPNEAINKGLSIINSQYFKMNNVIIKNFTHGLYIGTDCYDSSIENSRFQNCTYGVHSLDASDGNNISFYNCIMFYNDYGIGLGQGRNQSLYSCDIERNTTYGLYRFNSGDIQINNCYFEKNGTNDIIIEWGSQPVDNVLINGCSFFHSANDTAYVPIQYHGRENQTILTISNNDFVNGHDTFGNACVQKATASGKSLKPLFINNSLTNFYITDFTGFKGIVINNGDIVNFQKGYYSSYINGSDGGSTNISLDNYKAYRLNLPSSGTHTLNLPALSLDKTDYQVELSFILVGGNFNSNQNGNITFSVDTSTCTLIGNVTIDKTMVNKEFKAVYLGYISSKYHWQIIHT